ncbi:MAG: hypothetical protein ABF296_11790, partial [Oceanococcaceae bacterium]
MTVNSVRRPALAVALLPLLATLLACSPDGQDRSGATGKLLLESKVNGSALSGALVFADVDANGRLDSFEPFALTTAGGLTVVDAQACADAAVADNCLVVPEGFGDDVLLRIQGGFDRDAGLPFRGQQIVRAQAANFVDAAGSAVPARPDVRSTLTATLRPDTPALTLQGGDELRLNAVLAALLGKVGIELEAAGEGELVGPVTAAITTELGKELTGEDTGRPPQTPQSLIANPSILAGLLAKVLGEADQRKVLDGRAEEFAELARLVLRAVDAFAVDNPGVGRQRVAQVLVAKATRLGALIADLQRDSDWVLADP